MKAYQWTPTLWLLIVIGISEAASCKNESVSMDTDFVAANKHIDCVKREKYRRLDGTCNNKKCPTFGAAHTTFQRFIDKQGHPMVEYYNGSETRGGADSKLPSPRVLSNKLMDKKLDKNKKSHCRHTVMHMQIGQLVVHDMMDKKGQRGPNCCNTSDPSYYNTTICSRFNVPNDDKVLTPGCKSFVRSLHATKDNVRDKKLPDHPEQINEKSAVLDLGVMYGDNANKLEELRDPKCKYLMKTKPNGLLPEDKGRPCRKTDKEDFCMNAGDGRAGQYVTLILVHTALLREHNRIANKLYKLNPSWDDEKVFQETRRITIAMFQHIVFNEYLPTILDHSTMKKYNLYSNKHGFDSCYNDKINPAVRNVFTTAAFRLHPQVTEHVSLLKADYYTKTTLLLKEIFFKTTMVAQDKGANCPALARWMSYDPSRKISNFFPDVLRNHLFGRASDLASTNLQRGRDHGIPSYNKWRKFCGLKPAKFHDFGKKGKILKELYECVDDVDLYIGGLLESRGDKFVGETFACLIGKQFQLTKCGDSYWYEIDNPVFGFTKAQLASIKKVTLSKLLCDNFDLEKIQKNAFIAPKSKRELRYCHNLPNLDLHLWKSEECPNYGFKSHINHNSHKDRRSGHHSREFHSEQHDDNIDLHQKHHENHDKHASSHEHHNDHHIDQSKKHHDHHDKRASSHEHHIDDHIDLHQNHHGHQFSSHEHHDLVL